MTEAQKERERILELIAIEKRYWDNADFSGGDNEQVMDAGAIIAGGAFANIYLAIVGGDAPEEFEKKVKARPS